MVFGDVLGPGGLRSMLQVLDLGFARLALRRPVGRHRTRHARHRHRLVFAVRGLDGMVRVVHLLELESTAAG